MSYREKEKLERVRERGRWGQGETAELAEILAAVSHFFDRRASSTGHSTFYIGIVLLFFSCTVTMLNINTHATVVITNAITILYSATTVLMCYIHL